MIIVVHTLWYAYISVSFGVRARDNAVGDFFFYLCLFSGAANDDFNVNILCAHSESESNVLYI